MLLMFAVGALVVVGPMPVAIAVGGGVAVLLQFKPELHSIAQKLGDEDLRAIMQFVLITCIILPVLPNTELRSRQLPPASAAVPQLDVLNPREIWLMVVLIVGLSLGGYIIYKYFGRNAGILLGGILGGAISSTATTVSYARGTRNDPIRRRTAAIVIMIASTVMYLRVLVAVAVVSSWDFLQTLLLPMVILMLLTLLPAIVSWYRVRRRAVADAEAGKSDATEVGHRVRRDVRRGADGVGRGPVFLARPRAVRRGVFLRPDGDGRRHALDGAAVGLRRDGRRQRLADDRRGGDGQSGVEGRHRRAARRLAFAGSRRDPVRHPRHWGNLDAVASVSRHTVSGV